MDDDFARNQPQDLTHPATRHYTVTPANEDLPVRPRALYIAADGNAVIRDEGGVDVTYPVVAGQLLPIRANQIREGTTATVIAWY